MTLYVPTFGRTKRDLTLQQIPWGWLGRTVIVCGPKEGDFYADRYRTARIVESKLTTIAAKRKWIFEDAHKHKHEYIMMFDDDLVFFSRKKQAAEFGGFDKGPSEDWPTYVDAFPLLAKLRRAGEHEMNIILSSIQEAMQKHGYRHTAISQRFMNQVQGHEFITTAKCTHALGYHVPTVMERCKLGRVKMFEDLDYTIQLLRAGFDNAIYYWGAVNDPFGFNAPGGESGRRKVKDIDDGAKVMAKLHPGLVRVVERKNDKADVQGHYRIVVAWKKALGFDKR